MTEADCELDITTNEADYILETGEFPDDFANALETMLTLARKRKGLVTCKFTMSFEPSEEPSEDN